MEVDGAELERLEQRLVQMLDSIRVESERTRGVLVSINAMAGRVAEQVARNHAWEAILFRFFARYYSGQVDSVGAAVADRDLIAAQFREVAADEDAARHVEEIYQTLFTLIEAGWSSRRGPEQEDDGPPM